MYVDLSTNVPHYLTQFGQKVVKDAIGCHLLLDTHLHRSARMLLHTRTTLAYKG